MVLSTSSTEYKLNLMSFMCSITNVILGVGGVCVGICIIIVVAVVVVVIFRFVAEICIELLLIE